MTRHRLEAFSDGVLAIIITIMVLELKTPHGTDISALRPMLPVFLGYLLSFVYIGIYWNNHHHLLQSVQKISGPIMWANLHLLFWLSLVPFATGWLGENFFAPVPAAVYGLVLLLSAIAYFVLQAAIIAREGRESVLSRALGRDVKGWASLALYVAGIGLSLIWPPAGIALYVLVALIWLVPDRRIERALAEDPGSR